MNKFLICLCLGSYFSSALASELESSTETPPPQLSRKIRGCPLHVQALPPGVKPATLAFADPDPARPLFSQQMTGTLPLPDSLKHFICPEEGMASPMDLPSSPAIKSAPETED